MTTNSAASQPIDASTTAPTSSITSLVNYPCSLCGSESSEVLYEATLDDSVPLVAADFDCTSVTHGKHYRIVQCTKCSMTFCSPRPTFEALMQAYGDSEDELYVDAEDGRRRTFARALTRILPHQGRLLDVGCNTGVFLEEARKLGFQCYGIEPSSYAAKRARETKGLDVACGAIPCALPWSEPFDVITMWDVIEHVDDPLGMLRFLRSHLKDGGHLHLSTMNQGSLYPRLAGHAWPWYMRMHIQYFTKKTITEMLKAAGFRDVRIQRYSHVVHSSYLRRKLEKLALPLRLIGRIGELVVRDRDGYVRVDMGDMMHVDATA